jgi:hypothetical protein
MTYFINYFDNDFIWLHGWQVQMKYVLKSLLENFDFQQNRRRFELPLKTFKCGCSDKD